VLQCVAMSFCEESGETLCRRSDAVWCSVLQCVAVCCSVLQYVAVCCSVFQWGLEGRNFLSEIPLLQCVAVCRSVL